ncbi:peptidoglycan DD-metalloendopeptidase family protein [Erythrobacter sp. Alg231-14]|uniref:peptidoglycan DD-metalloendopeptidase family protein n=1 Tax=Erythrobacter sp. Alg231-14 TaxID=1922225 RepID=UPI000D55D58F
MRNPAFHTAAFGFLALALIAAMALAVPNSRAQRNVAIMEPDEAQAELERATRESRQAQTRADRFTQASDDATIAADKTASEAAAIAAQIQAAEANIAAARARYSLTQADRTALSARLAERQQPLVRLTGALQTTARRPLALSALQPGSLKDLVYVRAVLASAVPEIRDRTAALRGELEQGRALEQQAARELESLGAGEEELQARRADLAALESRQRLASREARGNALREGERALALAEEARDLDGLIDVIDDAAMLRRELAALPGPVMRPANIAADIADIDASDSTPTPAATTTALTAFQLPVQGRTIAGFGEMRESGLRSKGLSLAPQSGAQVVAPASGRIAFAGPYRGFGRIVIIEHPGGWTSLVTGLERVAAEVGDEVIGGAPLGVAGGEDPMIGIELRQDGEPVNPLNFLR